MKIRKVQVFNGDHTQKNLPSSNNLPSFQYSSFSKLDLIPLSFFILLFCFLLSLSPILSLCSSLHFSPLFFSSQESTLLLFSHNPLLLWTCVALAFQWLEVAIQMQPPPLCYYLLPIIRSKSHMHPAAFLFGFSIHPTHER